MIEEVPAMWQPEKMPLTPDHEELREWSKNFFWEGLQNDFWTQLSFKRQGELIRWLKGLDFILSRKSKYN